jgi:hypothetical protein
MEVLYNMSLLTSLANASIVSGASSGASGPVLSASRPIVEEGDEVQFILYVPDGIEGTSYAYTITGITQDDLFYGTLTGNFTLDSAEGAQVAITLARDSVPEIETITMTVSSLEVSVRVTITDTSPAPVGEQIYDTAGTYQWVCPAGVTSVSAVAIGPGGNGIQVFYSSQSQLTSGSGGGLGFRNNISVTPGMSYTVQVGTSGLTDSYFISTATVRGGYGINGSTGTGTKLGGSYTGTGGASGGSSRGSTISSYISGGGGAGGWSSSGGAGGYNNSTNGNGLNSTTGGAGGASGYWSYSPGYPAGDYSGYAGKGGGQNLYGSIGSTTLGGLWEGSSSNGNTGNDGGSYNNGIYGAGGKSAAYKTSPYADFVLAGGPGAVRIIWGSGRSFSNNAGYVAQSTSVSNTLIQTLDNPNPYATSANDNFGSSVAISGNYAIVSAFNESDAGGTYSGKAYIFNVSTGALVHTLNNPNAYGTTQSDYFGNSVAISGNYAIVSAYGEDDAGATDSGKAYIFSVSTGALVHTLNNPNAYGTSNLDYFGNSVAISGNYAIVSANLEDDTSGTNGLSSGKAYIFNVSTGTLIHTLDNPNAYGTGREDWFGNSVAISDNYAIVGAYREDDAGGTTSGKAYIFDVTTGQLVHTLNNPSSSTAEDQFGYSVAISGDYAIVGAPNDTLIDSGSGTAYVFNATTGTLVKNLYNPNAFGTRLNDSFGYSVAISGNYAIVGARNEDDTGGLSSGVAYVFDISSPATVPLITTLTNPNAYGTSSSDNFGYSVAISGNYTVVGAYAEDDAGGGNSGKAYIYKLTQD